ncbi:hypothetical protein PRIPAC_77873 [Pristionchus pacificus]|uniref:G protein-coupled receptor n=1 Tax=Pristionchus pacificus TaxID=54126 RepID=A0A2A6CL64_PRIPA|nr:hypothetical protein PRIPAC_77873 [Pristionchus pacificus]|eukprot:PDM78793.1 G protein-coupled receptor [Pristionchus pacificus]
MILRLHCGSPIVVTLFHEKWIFPEKMAFTHIVYIPLLVSGFVANILLLTAVARGTPSTLKTYPILIIYCALNDLIDIIADVAAFERYFFENFPHILEMIIPD